MQALVHHQHDGVAKIKYREELRSRYAKFVYCNYNRVVLECHVSGRRDRELRGFAKSRRPAAHGPPRPGGPRPAAQS